MPITQPRMLSLIAAAQDFRDGLFKLCQTIHAQAYSISQGQKTPSQAMSELTALAMPQYFLDDPLNSAAIVETERKHFQRVAKDNRRAADRQTLRRGGKKAEEHEEAMKREQGHGQAQFSQTRAQNHGIEHVNAQAIRLQTIRGVAATEKTMQASLTASSLDPGQKLIARPDIMAEAARAAEGYKIKQEAMARLASSGANPGSPVNPGSPAIRLLELPPDGTSADENFQISDFPELAGLPIEPGQEESK